jgi:hypothetical protein
LRAAVTSEGFHGVDLACSTLLLNAALSFDRHQVNHAYYQGVRIGCAFRTALMSLIFEKALRCSSFARSAGSSIAHPPGSDAAKAASAAAAAGGTGQTGQTDGRQRGL